MSENSLVSERYFISKKFPATTCLPHIFPSSTVSPRYDLYVSNMSSNVPTNEQNAAVGAGSDTDSISSLSSQAANMNLDRSSPPAVLSSEASDEEGDITIMKEDSPSEEEGPDEEGQMPFLDKHGEVSHPIEREPLPCCLYTATHKYTIPLFGLSTFCSFGHVSHYNVLHSSSHVSCAGEVHSCPLRVH